MLIMEVGTWKNFDEIEECLILDELLLLTEAAGKKRREHFRLLAASQGHEIPDDDDEEFSVNRGDEDLPEELLEAERALQARKAQELGPKTHEVMTESGLGLGYEVAPRSVTDSILDQSVL